MFHRPAAHGSRIPDQEEVRILGGAAPSQTDPASPRPSRHYTSVIIHSWQRWILSFGSPFLRCPPNTMKRVLLHSVASAVSFVHCEAVLIRRRPLLICLNLFAVRATIGVYIEAHILQSKYSYASVTHINPHVSHGLFISVWYSRVSRPVQNLNFYLRLNYPEPADDSTVDFCGKTCWHMGYSCSPGSFIALWVNTDPQSDSGTVGFMSVSLTHAKYKQHVPMRCYF